MTNEMKGLGIYATSMTKTRTRDLNQEEKYGDDEEEEWERKIQDAMPDTPRREKKRARMSSIQRREKNHHQPRPSQPDHRLRTTSQRPIPPTKTSSKWLHLDTRPLIKQPFHASPNHDGMKRNHTPGDENAETGREGVKKYSSIWTRGPSSPLILRNEDTEWNEA
ncbi:hypothetical protein BJ165DRAFT_1409858 [Panaeolus papilionaceus]|nr:hypothetical protein BJ165DRAFT_1409858 [Panaeolus papilionaceus]